MGRARDSWRRSMISISITAKAYEAIKASLSELDNPAPSPASDGLIRVWLDRAIVGRLGRLRGPGESYGDVMPILLTHLHGLRCSSSATDLGKARAGFIPGLVVALWLSWFCFGFLRRCIKTNI